MVMLGLSQQRTEVAMATAATTTTNSAMNDMRDHGGLVGDADCVPSIVGATMAHDDSSTADMDGSRSSSGYGLYQLEELLMESGLARANTTTDNNNTANNKSDTSLLNAKKNQNRLRTSSSFSEMSFLAATQQQDDVDEDDQEETNRNHDQVSIASFASSHRNQAALDAKNNCHILIKAQFLPAPTGGRSVDVDDYEDSVNGNITKQEPTDNNHCDESLFSVNLQDEPSRKEEPSVPIYSLSGLQLLAAKIKHLSSSSEKKPSRRRRQQQQHQSLEPQQDTAGLETRSIVSEISGISELSNDQQSVSSVQSLISVVAELISKPIRVVSAIVAELEQEIFMGTPVGRSEFVSATTLLHNTTTTTTPLGLQLDRSSGSGASSTDTPNIHNNHKVSLVITSIDPQGLWASSPLCVGDRIISMNHVCVSDWHVEAVHEYWEELLAKGYNSVTIVAHNPTGDAQWVQAMVTKPDPSCRTGLGMRSSRPGRVKISRVGGLFANSILNPGDQILSINGIYMDGYNSAEAADLILQSPKYVTIVAKTDARTAFVIAAKDNGSSTSLTATSSADGGEAGVQGHAMNRGDHDNDGIAQRRLLDPTYRCDNWSAFRQGHMKALRTLLLIVNLYIVLVLALGLFFSLSNNARLPLVLGVLICTVFMKMMISATIYQLVQRARNKDLPPPRCPAMQMTSNIILMASFVFLMLMWGKLHYEAITGWLVVGLSIVVFAPMMIIVNLPCILPQSFFVGEEDENDDADIEEAVVGEHEAVASLAGTP